MNRHLGCFGIIKIRFGEIWDSRLSILQDNVSESLRLFDTLEKMTVNTVIDYGIAFVTVVSQR